MSNITEKPNYPAGGNGNPFSPSISVKAPPYPPPDPYTQPAPNPGMLVAPGGNPLGKPLKPNGKRDWSYGLFECFGEYRTCCTACWCPCFVYGQNVTRMRTLAEHGQPHPNGGDSWGTDCLVFGLVRHFTGLGWILELGNRGPVRTRYGIDGNACDDCMAAAFCMPCALTQDSREIAEEERALAGLSAA